MVQCTLGHLFCVGKLISETPEMLSHADQCQKNGFRDRACFRGRGRNFFFSAHEAASPTNWKEAVELNELKKGVGHYAEQFFVASSVA